MPRGTSLCAVGRRHQFHTASHAPLSGLWEAVRTPIWAEDALTSTRGLHRQNPRHEGGGGGGRPFGGFIKIFSGRIFVSENAFLKRYLIFLAYRRHMTALCLVQKHLTRIMFALCSERRGERGSEISGYIRDELPGASGASQKLPQRLPWELLNSWYIGRA